MSLKASSLNASARNSTPSPASAPASTNSNAMNTSSTTAATPTVVKIKKELPSDEIKEFAESTMNELLGWYGFDSVDRLDISAKTSKLLQTSGTFTPQQQQQQQQQQQSHPSHHHMEKRRSRSSRAASLLQMHQQQQQQQHPQQNEHLRTPTNSNNHQTNNNNNNNNGGNNSNNNTTSNSGNSNLKSSSSLGNCNSTYRSGGNDSTNSDHDTRSSRDDDSKSPHSAGKIQTSTVNPIDEKIVDYQNCCWCRRPVPENAPEFLTTSDGPRYCSESCFTQSRRASFKKAKTCDWCKHVRHAVSYVDFQDGASQLQFCSDKCLNQYKMQIFCKETQAHLDMNPHLKEQGLEAASNGANLITPDLWLRNCRSRSASPASTVSISPGPSVGPGNLSADRPSITEHISPVPARIAVSSSLTATNTNNSASHKPLISVAPVSKLMSKSPNILPSRQSPKPNRKKRPTRTCVSNELSSSSARGGNEMKSTCASLTNLKPKPLLGNLNDNTRSNLNQTNTQTLTQFAASCVQDLHMNVPPLSPMMDSQSSQPTTPHSLTPNTPNRVNTTIPPAFFATGHNTPGPQPGPPPPMGITPQVFHHQRPPFMPQPAPGFLPRFLGNFNGFPPPPPPLQADLAALNALIGNPPPVTIMVPYPVIIPLPIPIPIPLPVVDFYKAYLKPEERRKYEEQQQQLKKERRDITEMPETSECSPHERNVEGPLDFTKTKETPGARNSPIFLEETTTNKEEEISSLNVIPSEDSQSTTKSLMCVVSSEEPETNREQHAVITVNDDNDNEDSNEPSRVNSDAGGDGGGNTEVNQKLPKLKITRLQTKRTLMQTKESECSRPLRKRKRIIDCDFQKFNNNNNNNNHNNPAKETNDAVTDVLETTDNETNKRQATTTTTTNSNSRK